jgi:hypothetical protein
MKAHHSSIIPCGLIFSAIGLFIRYQIGRRRFNRRGMAGLQQFQNYGKAVVTTLCERLILIIGNLCLLAGLFLLALAGFNHIKF